MLGQRSCLYDGLFLYEKEDNGACEGLKVCRDEGEGLRVSPDLLRALGEGLASLEEVSPERREEMSLTDNLGPEWALPTRLRSRTTLSLSTHEMSIATVCIYCI